MLDVVAKTSLIPRASKDAPIVSAEFLRAADLSGDLAGLSLMSETAMTAGVARAVPRPVPELLSAAERLARCQELVQGR
jgi:hypothetical protein